MDYELKLINGELRLIPLSSTLKKLQKLNEELSNQVVNKSKFKEDGRKKK